MNISKVNGNEPLLYEDIKIIIEAENYEKYIHKMCIDEFITLNDCLNIAIQNGYEKGTILVICESYLIGNIFRYGNYLNDKSWYQVGTMEGFA